MCISLARCISRILIWFLGPTFGWEGAKKAKLICKWLFYLYPRVLSSGTLAQRFFTCWPGVEEYSGNAMVCREPEKGENSGICRPGKIVVWLGLTENSGVARIGRRREWYSVRRVVGWTLVVWRKNSTIVGARVDNWQEEKWRFGGKAGSSEPAALQTTSDNK